MDICRNVGTRVFIHYALTYTFVFMLYILSLAAVSSEVSRHSLHSSPDQEDSGEYSSSPWSTRRLLHWPRSCAGENWLGLLQARLSNVLLVPRTIIQHMQCLGLWADSCGGSRHPPTSPTPQSHAYHPFMHTFHIMGCGSPPSYLPMW